MSNVPANARTTPAQRRSPNDVRTAATNVSATPTTVIWLCVTGMRPSADINASARRRTQASNRVVNIDLLDSTGLCPDAAGRSLGLLIDLDDLGGYGLPPKSACLLVSVIAHPAPKIGVPGKDD